MDSGMTALQMNELAVEIADSMEEDAPLLRVRSHTLGNGARVIDAGVQTPGGYDAGLAIAEICMGGLGSIAYAPVQIGDQSWPGVTVWTDHPAGSCMASQYAGWAIQVDRYFAMGSGPLRAHARVEKELFAKLEASGVKCDFREPNVIRAAPTPLYNTFHEVWRFAKILSEHQ